MVNINLKKEVSKKDWRLMEFNAPIKESLTEGGNFIIKGIAINETTTRNGITYIAEELSKAAESFRDKPILKDHEARIDNIVGRTTENVVWSDEMRAITFEAVIKDKGIQKMIEDGLVKNVSIGARVEDIMENDNGQLVAKGMEGLELSLVAVPGDAGAGISHAMRESFDMKKMVREMVDKKKEDEKKKVDEGNLNSIKLNKEVIKMTNEQALQDAAVKAVEEYKVAQEESRVKEEAEKVEAEKVAAEEKVKFDKAVADKVAEVAKLKEEAETKAKADEDDSKGQVNDGNDEDGDSAVDENYVVESADVGKGYSLYNNDVSKYNRLSR